MIVSVGWCNQPKAVANKAPNPNDGKAGTLKKARPTNNKTGSRVTGEIQKPAFNPAIIFSIAAKLADRAFNPITVKKTNDKNHAGKSVHSRALMCL